MIKLRKLLKEIDNGPYEYGCVMLYFDFNESQLTGIIDDKDIYDDGSGKYGKETEPHVTLLYGLHSNVSFLWRSQNAFSSGTFNKDGIWANDEWAIYSLDCS